MLEDFKELGEEELLAVAGGSDPAGDIEAAMDTTEASGWSTRTKRIAAGVVGALLIGGGGLGGGIYAGIHGSNGGGGSNPGGGHPAAISENCALRAMACSQPLVSG